MGKDTCNKCIHCTHETNGYYWCEVENGYIAAEFAMDERLECGLFVEELDDNQTEEP